MPALAAADPETSAPGELDLTLEELSLELKRRLSDPERLRGFIDELRAEAEHEPEKVSAAVFKYGTFLFPYIGIKPPRELWQVMFDCFRHLGWVGGVGRIRVVVEFSWRSGTLTPRLIRAMRAPPRSVTRPWSQRGKRRRRLPAFHHSRRGPPDDDDDLDQGRVAVSLGRRVA